MTNAMQYSGNKVDFVIVDDVEVSKIKAFPKVGDTVAIQHEVSRGKDGEVKGLRRCRPSVTHIRRVYLEGTIGTGIGDTWEVVPSNGKPETRGAKWMTVGNAKREERSDNE